MIVDAHQHFWRYSPQKHSWISPEMGVLKGDFLPDQLLKVYEENGVSACVAVQAEQSEEETMFLLELADKYDFIQGVVGWVDLRDKALESRLNYYQGFQKLKGFRHLVQDEPDPDFLLDGNFQEGLGLLEKYGFTYDLLIFPHQLNAAILTARKFPDLNIVLDHLAKPDIKNRSIEEWRQNLNALGLEKNVFCKISGMVTEASWGNWKQEDFLPYLDIVFDSFGIDRLMFGSDWPVCLLAGTFPQVLGIVKNYTNTLSEEEKNKLFYENATLFYGLKG